MEFMLIMISDRSAPEDPSVYQDMGQFAGELAGQGKLSGGAPLHPEADGARVHMENGKAVVRDGPFTETDDVIGGYFLVECER